MSDGSREITLGSVLSLLDRWRHLPAYQLERRADVLFALFLPEILEKRFCTSNLYLIPEFPIKKSLLGRGDTTFQSINVDYLGVSEDPTRVFLIELKTDMASIKWQQVEDLKSARSKGMTEIINGLKKIVKSNSVTSSLSIRGKYLFLLFVLEEAGVVRIPNADRLRNLVAKRQFRKADWKDKVNEIECLVNVEHIEIVYVLPKRCTDCRFDETICQLTFDKLAQHAGELGSVCEFPKEFADSLKRWKDEAGLCLPQ